MCMIADKAEKGRMTRMVRQYCTDIDWDDGFGADYVAGGFVVERKRWQEIPERMMRNENDLYMQLAKLQNAAEELGKDPVLLLEGPMADATSHTAVTTEQIQKYVAGAFELGIGVMTTLDETHTAKVLEKWDEPSARPDVSAIRDPSKVPPGERPRYILEGLDGVGPQTAQDLLRHFGTVEAVLCAVEGELREVDGIGPATAGKIRDSATEVYEG